MALLKTTMAAISVMQLGLSVASGLLNPDSAFAAVCPALMLSATTMAGLVAVVYRSRQVINLYLISTLWCLGLAATVFAIIYNARCEAWDVCSSELLAPGALSQGTLFLVAAILPLLISLPLLRYSIHLDTEHTLDTKDEIDYNDPRWDEWHSL
ncbi:hypothetical protein HDU91_001214 [Kappamyces sp. JEL0680]|nr:hypothetical protein HDU91_001214 [Kappamyces sp. JEL0680]